MRSVVFSIALMLATATVAQSQQALSPSPVNEPVAQAARAPVAVAAPSAELPAVDAPVAPVGLTRSDAVLKPVHADRAARANGAAMDPTARNMFAIVGVVVVIIALVALLS